MANKTEVLEKFKNRLNELRPIVERRFKTSKELQKHVIKNKKVYEEANTIFKEIQQLEYELMSPKEREEYDEYRRLSKLKAEGKFPL